MSFSLTLGTYDVAWPDLDEAVEWYGGLKGNILDGTNMTFDIFFSEENAKGKIIEEAILGGYAVLPGKIEIIEVGKHDQGVLPVLQLKSSVGGVGSSTDYPTTMALASGDPWPTAEDNPLFDATFVVQRGDEQFSCLGSELGTKLLDDDLLLAQRGDTHGNIVKGNIQDADLFIVTDGDNGHKSVTGAQVKALFGEPVMPWEGHNGGIFHIKNLNQDLMLTGPKLFTAYDLDGSNERQIRKINSGEELVFVTDASISELFKDNSNKTATWDFGEHTDTSKVTHMVKMFYSCHEFNSASVCEWDVSNVVDMRQLFMYAHSFNQPLDKWDTSNVTDMYSLFKGSGFNNSSIVDWNISKVWDMGYLFANETFDQDISHWDISNVTSMKGMFNNNAAFSHDITGWNTSNVTNMAELFKSCRHFNQDISGWDTSKVTLMWGMFDNCPAFNQDIGGWNTSNVTDMSAMFRDADGFNQDISGWDTSKVDDMELMFYDADAFSQNLSKWCVTLIDSYPYWFADRSGLAYEVNKQPQWGTCPRGEDSKP